MLSFLEHTIEVLVDLSLTRNKRQMCQYLMSGGCKCFTVRDVVYMHVSVIVLELTTT
jgi:hypothetical protein